MKVTLKQLAIFVAAAKTNSVSKAAVDCFITQSGASIALAELESALGLPVFDRLGKKIRINADGQMLLPKAVEILSLAQELEGYQQVEANALVGEVRVGASSTIGNYILPSYLQSFNQQYPNIALTCDIANTKEIITAVKNFELDLGLIEGEVNDTAIKKELWQEDELVVFANAQHSLGAKSQVNISELKECEWVMRELGSGTREVFDKSIQSCFSPQVKMTVGSSEAVKSIVAQSDFLGCLSRFTIKDEVDQGELKELLVPALNIKRPLYLILNIHKHRTRVLELFLRVL